MTQSPGQGQALDNLLTESRTFPPSDEFAAQANAQPALYEEAKADREAFWAKQAERLHWDTKWTQVLDWSDAPFAKWFVGGKLNVAYNCVDRHVENGLGDPRAWRWRSGSGVEYLDVPAGAPTDAVGYAFESSEDGDVVVGSYVVFDPSLGPTNHGFYWTPTAGMQDITQFLAGHGITFGGDDWIEMLVVGVTPDGGALLIGGLDANYQRHRALVRPRCECRPESEVRRLRRRLGRPAGLQHAEAEVRGRVLGL